MSTKRRHSTDSYSDIRGKEGVLLIPDSTRNLKTGNFAKIKIINYSQLPFKI